MIVKFEKYTGQHTHFIFLYFSFDHTLTCNAAKDRLLLSFILPFSSNGEPYTKGFNDAYLRFIFFFLLASGLLKSVANTNG